MGDADRSSLVFTGLDLIGSFNYTGVCWNRIGGHKQSKRSLRSINDNILTQTIEGQ